ncbi:hypothetical protein ACFQ08_45195, partial [Streptosporangium algeriense]
VADVPLPTAGTGFEVAVLDVRTGEGARLTVPEGTRLAHGVSSTTAVERGFETGQGLFTASFEAPPPRQPFDAVAPQRVTVMPVAKEARDETLFAGEGNPQGAYLGPLPIVVTADLAAGLHLTTGATAKVTFDRRITVVKVAGVVDGVPGTAPGAPAVLLDWQTMQAWDMLGHHTPRVPTEW